MYIIASRFKHQLLTWWKVLHCSLMIIQKNCYNQLNFPPFAYINQVTGRPLKFVLSLKCLNYQSKTYSFSSFLSTILGSLGVAQCHWLCSQKQITKNNPDKKTFKSSFCISCLIHLFIIFRHYYLPVKTYAKNLIKGIISDTITHVPISDDDDLADEEEENDKCNINEQTDVSLSLETDNMAGSGPSTAVLVSKGRETSVSSLMLHLSLSSSSWVRALSLGMGT